MSLNFVILTGIFIYAKCQQFAACPGKTKYHISYYPNITINADRNSIKEHIPMKC